MGIFRTNKPSTVLILVCGTKKNFMIKKVPLTYILIIDKNVKAFSSIKFLKFPYFFQRIDNTNG